MPIDAKYAYKVLLWCVGKAPNVPAFVAKALAAWNTEGRIARVVAVMAFAQEVANILADFPMPDEGTVGPFTLVAPLNDHLCANGVSAADAAEFCECVDCVA